MTKFISLRTRMTLSVSLLFAMWMLLACLGLLAYANHNAEQLATKSMRSTAFMFADDVNHMKEHPHDSPDEHHPDHDGDHTHPPMPEPSVLERLIDIHRDELISAHLVALIVGNTGTILKQSQLDIPFWPLRARTKDWRVLSTMVEGQQLVIAYHWAPVQETLRRQSILLLNLSIAVVLFSAFCTWILVGSTLTPIGKLSQQARAASVDSLHIRLSAPSRDGEIVELVATLNGMLSRLSETALLKSRFYAAASHELRSPLQALSGQLEFALSRPRNTEEYVVKLQQALTQTRRLISLVKDLLLLNQLDMTPNVGSREVISLTDICERILQHQSARIAQREVVIDAHYADDGEVLAPPMHAEMLLRNVIENAVKYATTGSQLTLAVDTHGQAVRVQLFNYCPAIPELDTELLFEPFYRPDTSRNTETGGNGLGLAICKSIAQSNHWTLTLTHNGEGMLVEIVIPKHQEAQQLPA